MASHIGSSLWLSDAINNEIGNGDVSLLDYIQETFPKYEIEPHKWHDILAKLNVCSNFLATRHFKKEGYNLISMKMIIVVLLEEVDEVIPKEIRLPRLDYTCSYNEEIILEGSIVDTSRII